MNLPGLWFVTDVTDVPGRLSPAEWRRIAAHQLASCPPFRSSSADQPIPEVSLAYFNTYLPVVAPGLLCVQCGSCGTTVNDGGSQREASPVDTTRRIFVFLSLMLVSRHKDFLNIGFCIRHEARLRTLCFWINWSCRGDAE